MTDQSVPSRGRVQVGETAASPDIIFNNTIWPEIKLLLNKNKGYTLYQALMSKRDQMT